MVRALVVDDYAYAGTIVNWRIEADREIEVVGQAADGVEALSKVEDLRPDVVTMDVVMPRMDGLKTLKYLMKMRPTPMVSALTHEAPR